MFEGELLLAIYQEPYWTHVSVAVFQNEWVSAGQLVISEFISPLLDPDHSHD